MRHHLHLLSVLAILTTPLLLPCLSFSQAAVPSTSHAAEFEDETSKVFSSVQKSLNDLPNEQRADATSEMQKSEATRAQALNLLGRVPGSQLLVMDPSTLTVQQRLAGISTMLDALNQNTQRQSNTQSLLQATPPTVQQVVDPSIGANPATQQGLVNAATILSQLVPSGTVTAASLGPLAQKYQSIGRLLWTTKALANTATPMWQLGGTVFVTGPGVVTTACHTLMGDGDQPLIDINGTSVTLRSDLVLKVDFGNSTTFQTMYPVIAVAAISGISGCDVAQLKIQGADNIPPLRIAAKDTNAQQILIVGYPLLSNYLPDTCDFNLGSTYTQFCNFHKNNPTIAKVISPGKVLEWDTHEQVSVFTYDAPTDGGQSGSPVFDAKTLEVIGIHYCCSGAPQNTGPLVCANWHPQNISWNEAIASSTVVGDSLLKPNFSNIDSITTAALMVPSVQPPGLIDAAIPWIQADRSPATEDPRISTFMLPIRDDP